MKHVTIHVGWHKYLLTVVKGKVTDAAGLGVIYNVKYE